MYDEYVKEYEHLMLRNAGTVNNKYFFEKADANKAFIPNETIDKILLTFRGDVNRDGNATIADVTALVNIILGKAVEGDENNYDFKAANVNEDEEITIADVTALVIIILGK